MLLAKDSGGNLSLTAQRLQDGHESAVDSRIVSEGAGGERVDDAEEPEMLIDKIGGPGVVGFATDGCDRESSGHALQIAVGCKTFNEFVCRL